MLNSLKHYTVKNNNIDKNKILNSVKLNGKTCIVYCKKYGIYAQSASVNVNRHVLLS